MISGCRYERAIKQSMNKVFDNRSSVHSIIAELVASYSHKTEVRPGSYLLCSTYDFFIVSAVMSQHWCKGFFCPPRIERFGVCHYYTPDVRCASRVQKKRIFSPFQDPCVRIRQRKFILKSKLQYEQVSNTTNVFA